MKKFWCHAQNCNEDKFGRKGSWLKNSRFWIHYSDTVLSWQHVFFSRFFHIEFEANQGEGQIGIGIGTPLLAIWIHFSTPKLSKFLTDKIEGYDDRAIKISVHDWTIWWTGWMSEDSWNSKEPWYRDLLLMLKISFLVNQNILLRF